MAELMRYAQMEENRRMYWGPRYEAANQQMTIRIAARENILIGYIAAAATLIGVAFGSPDFRKIALVIPYMAAAVALILSNHENVIRQLEGYLAGLTEDVPDDWSSRRKITLERIRGLGYRTGALFVIIGGSSSAAVLIGREVAAGNVAIWYLGIVFTVLAIFWIVRPRMLRLQQYLSWIRMYPPQARPAQNQ